MKNQYLKLLFTIIASLTITFSYAQDTLVQTNGIGECGTEPAGPTKRYTSNQLNAARVANNNNQYVFNVKTHFIDNIVPEAEQELKALDLVGALNLYFNSANIFFKYQGYDNIEDSNYLNLTGSNISDLIPNMSNNQIDIFIADTVNNTSAGVTWTWTSNSTGEITRKVIALRDDYLPTFNSANPTLSDFKNYTSIHEVGHYLGLYHPHQRWKYDNSGELEKVSDNAIDCSALEENLNNSQWDILGDFVQDTNPDRVKSQYDFNYYTNCALSWGNYHDDSCGNSINQSVFNPSMDNIMAYYHACRVDFSTNQHDFMRAFIEDESNGGFLTNQLNTVASLYQPFDRVVSNTIASVSDDNPGDGMATVCRNVITHRYQKGFNYMFNLSTSSSSTANVHEILEINKSDASIQTRAGYGYTFKIQQIDNYQYEQTGHFANIQPNCANTSEEICVEEAYIGGRTLSTSKFGSGQFTIKNLNGQEVSDPNLENNLESQKYHVIQKITESGVTTQKTIYKND